VVRPLNLVSSREAEMRVIHSAQFELSVDGVPRSYRDRKDFALQNAQILKARNPKVATEMLDAYSGAMPLRGRPSRGCEAVN
jgi:hypothetical protein